MKSIDRRKYRPLKDGGYASHQWDTVNWANSATAIAKLVGVTIPAVLYQRNKRGIPPYYKQGVGKKARRDYRP